MEITFYHFSYFVTTQNDSLPINYFVLLSFIEGKAQIETLYYSTTTGDCYPINFKGIAEQDLITPAKLKSIEQYGDSISLTDHKKLEKITERDFFDSLSNEAFDVLLSNTNNEALKERVLWYKNMRWVVESEKSNK